MAKQLNCKLSAAQEKTMISFQPSIPDGLEHGTSVDGICIATEADVKECFERSKNVKVGKKGSKFEGMHIVNFNLPFELSIEGIKMRKNVNCNGATVTTGESYKVAKAIEKGENGREYHKFILIGK